jgi:hypothetical protein
VLVEPGSVPQHDHDVDIAQRLGLGVPPIGTGEEVADDVEGLVQLVADLPLPAAGGGVLGVGGLQVAAERPERVVDRDHLPLLV